METWPAIASQAGLALGAIFVVWLFLTGRAHTEKEFQREVQRGDNLNTALEAERKINNELARTGNVTNQLLGALTGLAAERQGIPPPRIVQMPPEDVTKI